MSVEFNMPPGNWYACNVDGVTVTNPYAQRTYPAFPRGWDDWNSPEDAIYDA